MGERAPPRPTAKACAGELRLATPPQSIAMAWAQPGRRRRRDTRVGELSPSPWHRRDEAQPWPPALGQASSASACRHGWRVRASPRPSARRRASSTPAVGVGAAGAGELCLSRPPWPMGGVFFFETRGELRLKMTRGYFGHFENK